MVFNATFHNISFKSRQMKTDYFNEFNVKTQATLFSITGQ